ncbi:M23 family metallopeptidase [Tsuneonella suprasediminis]|uniref:M23 family metallopeptidase n=1 Tax=Tsuneonella suprasediminis TaxID=2306996 RepID=A0A419R5M4_9SPHN|nr:M23 family metallopeptidase [Tsuneonella suprasediminis]RJX70874.1 M23 family metallopeptidase [Tsuneonella suprasediminis]
MMRYAIRPLLLGAALLLATAAGDPATETEHVVQEGETLSGIANRAGVEAVAIAVANGLAEPYSVQAGQKLTIPRQRTHTVKAGETGYGIARRYGVPFQMIAIANGLDDSGTVKLGQKLIIPAMVTPPARTQATPTEPYFRRPHDGTILLGYAVRADGKGHDGIDIAANPLDMVRAAASGSVIGISHHDPRMGRMVTLDHGNGWRTVYGHLARITVKMGDVVKTGERIGLAGHSGDAKRTELHFGIQHNRKPVDPATRLPR